MGIYFLSYLSLQKNTCKILLRILAASSSPPDVDTAEINKKLLKMYRIMQRCNQRSVPLPLPKNLPVKCQYRSVLVLEIFWIDICR